MNIPTRKSPPPTAPSCTAPRFQKQRRPDGQFLALGRQMAKIRPMSLLAHYGTPLFFRADNLYFAWLQRFYTPSPLWGHRRGTLNHRQSPRPSTLMSTLTRKSSPLAAPSYTAPRFQGQRKSDGHFSALGRQTAKIYHSRCFLSFVCGTCPLSPRRALLTRMAPAFLNPFPLAGPLPGHTK